MTISPECWLPQAFRNHHHPEGLLNPHPAAVVAGNVETSGITDACTVRWAGGFWEQWIISRLEMPATNITKPSGGAVPISMAQMRFKLTWLILPHWSRGTGMAVSYCWKALAFAPTVVGLASSWQRCHPSPSVFSEPWQLRLFSVELLRLWIAGGSCGRNSAWAQ